MQNIIQISANFSFLFFFNLEIKCETILVLVLCANNFRALGDAVQVFCFKYNNSHCIASESTISSFLHSTNNLRYIFLLLEMLCTFSKLTMELTKFCLSSCFSFFIAEVKAINLTQSIGIAASQSFCSVVSFLSLSLKKNEDAVLCT